MGDQGDKSMINGIQVWSWLTWICIWIIFGAWKAMPGDLVIYHLPTEMHPEESTIITISLRTVNAMPSAVVHKKIADRCGCSSPLKYCSRDFDPAKNGSKLEGWNGLRTWGKWYQCDNVFKKNGGFLYFQFMIMWEFMTMWVGNEILWRD